MQRNRLFQQYEVDVGTYAADATVRQAGETRQLYFGDSETAAAALLAAHKSVAGDVSVVSVAGENSKLFFLVSDPDGFESSAVALNIEATVHSRFVEQPTYSSFDNTALSHKHILVFELVVSQQVRFSLGLQVNEFFKAPVVKQFAATSPFPGFAVYEGGALEGAASVYLPTSGVCTLSTYRDANVCAYGAEATLSATQDAVEQGAHTVDVRHDELATGVGTELTGSTQQDRDQLCGGQGSGGELRSDGVSAGYGAGADIDASPESQGQLAADIKDGQRRLRQSVAIRAADLQSIQNFNGLNGKLGQI